MGIQKILKFIDIFGTPVKMFYKGKDTYKTGKGGCLTILYTLMIAAYFIMMILQVVKRSTTLSNAMSTRELTHDSSP